MIKELPALEKLESFSRPTALGFSAVLHSYKINGAVLFALAKGDVRQDGVSVRIQSPCLFGESFGVNSCDCGAQLTQALQTAATTEAFLLIYLSDQEGRGHGVETKLRAVEKEANLGLSMPEAFRALNLEFDKRSYEAAAAIIKDLIGNHAICLLTNNPKKVEGLEDFGIEVNRVAHVVDNPTDECRRYLRSKRDEMGHLLPVDL